MSSIYCDETHSLALKRSPLPPISQTLIRKNGRFDMAGKRTKQKERGSAANPSVPEASEVEVADEASEPVEAAAPLTLALPADFRIAAQTAFKQQLIGALDHDAIVLDGGAVERVDTAALQLLVVFQRELDARQRAPSWQSASPVLTEAAEVLGLTQTLKMPAPELA
ncbi:MAG TPA: STAS domain-containing protein [Rhodanobacter sp.]|nr:STAS domain-containing protein [Rhodanobacter sp.]